MKIRLHLTLHTETVVGGGESPPITMFTRTVEFELTPSQFIDWSEDRYFQVGDLNFRPATKDLKHTGKDLVEGPASHYILRRDDTDKYYKDLQHKGWMPCFEHTRDIQASGYPNFQFWVY